MCAHTQAMIKYFKKKEAVEKTSQPVAFGSEQLEFELVNEGWDVYPQNLPMVSVSTDNTHIHMQYLYLQ